MITYRPWGWMITLIKTPWFWFKVLKVQGKTSLQYHTRRTELQIGANGIHLCKPFVVHRLEHGWFVEFAWGRPNERDVVRLEDLYGRK